MKIAILDTGISAHEDMVVSGGVSFVGDRSSFFDDHGHGTHIAGVIGSRINSIGIVGTAPNAELYAVKVLDSAGEGYYSQVIEGIEWGIANGIDIISISFGGLEYSSILHDVIKRAVDSGIIIVASAGNNGDTDGQLMYPANYPEVVSVGAVGKSFYRPSFSNSGTELDLSAPGVDILSAKHIGGYGTSTGTSVSAAFVAGAFALLKEQQLSNVEALELLRNTATQIGEVNHYGHGIVNIARAIGIINVPIPPVFLGTDEYTDPIPPIFGAGNGDVVAAASEHTGDEQIINPGESATVSLKISHFKSKVYIGVFNSSGDKINGTEVDNVAAGTTIPYTWITNSSTVQGTYKIKYAYHGESIEDWFTIYVVQAPSAGEVPSKPTNIYTDSTHN